MLCWYNIANDSNVALFYCLFRFHLISFHDFMYGVGVCDGAVRLSEYANVDQVHRFFPFFFLLQLPENRKKRESRREKERVLSYSECILAMMCI